MRKRRDRTEFAVWLKHETPTALRLDVPLGFLERQPTLSEEAYDELLCRNRERFCGTMADVLAFDSPKAEPSGLRAASRPERPLEAATPAPSIEEPFSEQIVPKAEPSALRPREPPTERELGKGGPKHRYLQPLVKELAQQQGFLATIETPLSGGGQVDVLLEREDVRAAVEVSVTTPVDYERQNVRKCLAAGFAHVAFVLTKSKASRARYEATITEGLTPEERSRLTFLLPEELPDYIAFLAPPPEASETIVSGYRVKVSRTVLSARRGPRSACAARKDRRALAKEGVA